MSLLLLLTTSTVVVTRSATIPWEDIKTLVRKMTSPWDDLASLSRRVSMSTDDVPTVRTARVIPIEMLASLKRTALDAFDSRGVLTSGRTLPWEDLASIKRGANSPIEMLAGLRRSISDPFNSSGVLVQGRTIPFDALKTLRESRTLVDEMLAPVARRASSPDDVLAGNRLGRTIPYESLGTLSRLFVQNGGYFKAMMSLHPTCYYRLNDVSAQVVDASGNGFTGSFSATVTKGALGLLSFENDLAMQFTNTGFVIPGGDQSTRPGLGSFTWAFLFKSRTTASMNFSQAGGATVLGHIIRLNTAGNGRIDCVINNQISCDTGAGSNYNDGNPHHVAVVLDRVAGRLKIFVDKIKKADIDASAVVANLTASNNSLGNGGDATATTIDEFGYIPAALTDVQIEMLYNAAFVTPGAPPIEWLASLKRSAIDPIEVLTGLHRQDGIPAEWTGAAFTALTRRGIIPIEWLSALRRTDGASFDSTNTVARRGASPIEMLASLRRSGIIPIEALGALRRFGLSPYESSGQVSIALRRNGALPIEWAGIDPDSLLMIWNVIRLLDSPFPQAWNVLQIAAAFSLEMNWTIREAIFALPLIWQVFPDLYSLFGIRPDGSPATAASGLGPGDIQMPVATITLP